ncbi:ras guanine nucleotide exchange factor P isoform X2 [Aphidius gifuensis]|uniref:ras guanine nucleotide exchange factor P isoform X2 n=1 Tax=Aphidius gifuensis TaxID=684658 RepID=UPI001CDC1D93|nr:ras guanine nucleotide exchange factor P isoform X2 [Aphidius gifuensis]
MSLVGKMYDVLVQQDAWCYWVISIAVIVSLVGFILACICSCRHNDNKTNSANRSLPDIPKDRNPGLNDSGLTTTTQDVIYEANEVISDPSELYATVQDKNIIGKINNERVTRASSQESSSLAEDDSGYPYARLNPVKTTTDEHPYAQVQSVQKTEPKRKNSFINNPSQNADSSIASISSKSTNPVAPPRTRRSLSQNSLLNVEILTCDIQAANAITGGVQANQDLPYMTPPLLMTLPRLPGNNTSQTQLHLNSQIQQQQQLQSQSQQQPQQQQQQQQQLQQSQQQQQQQPQHFSGDSQDSKGYTSISVREPLANIIAQTKAAQSRQQSQRPSADSHYATVSDDSDEMYAAIDEQEKIYTSGSETYAQIQPMTTATTIETNRVVVHNNEQLLVIPSSSHNIPVIVGAAAATTTTTAMTTTTPATTTAATELVDDSVFTAPQPPSVDSLRYVAHAHSRQASSSSATSSIINPSSPKPEKRQANSPLPPPPPPLPVSSVDDDDDDDNDDNNDNMLIDPYALIDKIYKTNDNNNQVMINNCQGLAVGKSLEDMYAKVMKRKRDPEEERNILTNLIDSSSARKLSVVDVSRISWSSRDSMEFSKKEPESNPTTITTTTITSTVTSTATTTAPALLSNNNPSDLLNMHAIEFAKVSRIYELDKTPEYEDDDYQISSSSSSSISNTRVQQKATRPRSNVNLKNVDSNYEILKPQKLSLNNNKNNNNGVDKNEKSTNSSSNLMKNHNGIDVLPFYSVPLKNRQVSNASSEDPGYEKVRLRRRNDNDIDNDNDNDDSEPNYESMPHEPNYASVCRPGDSDTDPNYESVNNSDPNYESVRYVTTNKIHEQKHQEPPYEQVNAFNKNLNKFDGYEKVKTKKIKKKTTTTTSDDSNYEKIQINDDGMMDSVDISDDEQYVQV